MSELARLKTDLMCAYGFNKKNAEAAITMYKEHRLSAKETSALDTILKNDPFKMQHVKPDRLEHLKWTSVQTLNKLNYKLSEGIN